MPIHNADIARLFEEMADLLEIGDANPFRVRAYRNAARLVGAEKWGQVHLSDRLVERPRWAIAPKLLPGRARSPRYATIDPPGIHLSADPAPCGIGRTMVLPGVGSM